MPLPHLDPIELPDAVTVERWDDPLVERLGHPIGSDYVETFWLPTLGPTTLLLARRLAASTATGPTVVPLAPLAEALGLHPTLNPNAPLAKSFHRLRIFGVADYNDGTVRVRTHLAPLNARQIRRLPKHLAAIVATVPA